MERSNEVKSEPHMKLTIRGSILTKHDFKRLLPPALRSGVMGTFVGVLPGAGATTGAFMGYAAQKKFKNEEELGTGAIEGIAASEAANNAPRQVHLRRFWPWAYREAALAQCFWEA